MHQIVFGTGAASRLREYQARPDREETIVQAAAVEWVSADVDRLIKWRSACGDFVVTPLIRVMVRVDA